jgi:hypothetical protein
MTTTIYLMVQIMINGVWVAGDELEGWASMQMPDMATCLRAASRGNNHMPPANIEDVLFSCGERETFGVRR